MQQGFPTLDQRRRVQRRWFVVMAAVALTGSVLSLVPSAAEAQWPITKLQNVKALPADIPIPALIDTMKSFTRALGVRCTYCHVGKESDPLSAYDFASDEKPEKLKAREMLRMVSAISTDFLSKLPSRRDPSVPFQCATCHHGIPQPRPLQQVLLMAYDGGGADSLERTYRALRKRYYGAAAYDFGEVPLADVATALLARSKTADAVKAHLLNIEMSPTSVFALWQAADAQATAGDTAGAVATIRRAQAIAPNNPNVLGLLRQLGQKP